MKRFVAPGTFAAAIGFALATGVLAVLDAPEVWWKALLGLTLAAFGSGAWLVYRLAQRIVRDLARSRAEQKRDRKAAATDAGRILSEVGALGRTTSSGLAQVRKDSEQLDLQVRELAWLARDLQDQRILDAEKRAADAEKRAADAEKRAADAERQPPWLALSSSTGTENA